MITVTKTNTHGFRAERFRNQIVHQYYGHLQSVMQSIEPSGRYRNLFAKPEIGGFIPENGSVEWTTQLSGQPVHYSMLSDVEKQRIEAFVSEAFSCIRKYIAENKDKSGKEKDYSLFLDIVGKMPHPNQIWVVGGNPTIVQWGYNDENNLMGSSGIYPNWETFLSEIHKAKVVETPIPVTPKVEVANEEVKPQPELVVASKPSDLFKEKEKENIPQTVKPESKIKKSPKNLVKAKEDKRLAMAGLGGYWWVKWLAILLLIIILLILLLRLLAPNNSFFGQSPFPMNVPTIINGGMGGSGQGGNGQGGGSEQGGNNGQGNGQDGANLQKGGSNDPNSKQSDISSLDGLCPVCKKEFNKHSVKDYKECLIKAQESSEEMKKKLQEFTKELEETSDVAEKTGEK